MSNNDTENTAADAPEAEHSEQDTQDHIDAMVGAVQAFTELHGPDAAMGVIAFCVLEIMLARGQASSKTALDNEHHGITMYANLTDKRAAPTLILPQGLKL